MAKKCQLCGRDFPDSIMQDVIVTYSVDGQFILYSYKCVCPNCSGGVAREVFGGSMFPSKRPLEKYDPLTHHDRHGKPCHDCGAAEGEYHQNGCDWERCPVCGLQLISCGHAKEVRIKKNAGSKKSCEN